MVTVKTESIETLRILIGERSGIKLETAVFKLEMENAKELFEELLITGNLKNVEFVYEEEQKASKNQEKEQNETLGNEQPNNEKLEEQEGVSTGEKLEEGLLKTNLDEGHKKREIILEYVNSKGENVTVKEIDQKFGFGYQVVAWQLRDLVMKGKIQKVGRGIYQSIPKGEIETVKQEEETEKTTETPEPKENKNTSEKPIIELMKNDRYSSIIKYIFTNKERVKVENIRRMFEREQEEITEVIKASINENLIEEKEDEIGTYIVNSYSRLWYYLAVMDRQIAYAKIKVDTRLREEDLNKAIEQGLKRKLIKVVKSGETTCYKAI